VSVKRIRRPPDQENRVTSVELFFDLVFVFVVTQLSQLLTSDLTARGAARTTLLLLAAWWAWVYTTWVTNWFDPETVVVRAILLVGMFAGMIGAISIPDAFGSRGVLLVAGYVAIQAFRNVFIVAASDRDDALHVPFLRILGWTAMVMPLWIAGAFADGDARLVIWSVALVLDYAGPLAGHWTPGLGRSRPSDWDIEPSHFVERLELFLIIALGESIVAAGATASGLVVTVPRLTAVLVAMLMTTAFWWLYFDFHAGRTLERLRAAADERGRLGRDLSYLYVLLVAGIIVAAVGNELVIAHPGAPLHGAELVALAAGPVLYLVGSVALKAVTALGASLPRLALWALVLGVLAALAGVEAIETRRGVRTGERRGAGGSRGRTGAGARRRRPRLSR
jgi:low temperature requirement protein LtrA